MKEIYFSLVIRRIDELEIYANPFVHDEDVTAVSRDGVFAQLLHDGDPTGREIGLFISVPKHVNCEALVRPNGRVNEGEERGGGVYDE